MAARPDHILALLSASTLASLARADAVTYVDHVRPIFAARCLNCHDADKAKGDLDLSTYAAAMRGSSGGRVASPGEPDASPLVGAVEHTREPYMPPRSAKLSDADIATIRAWVAGGCLESSGSAPAAPRPSVTLAAAPADGATFDLLALGLPQETRPPSARAPVAYALAAHPTVPLLALVAGRQVLLHDATTGALVGAFDGGDDDIATLRFSRDGRFVVAGCGFAAARGSVRVWSLPDGDEVVRVGRETDVALAADVDTLRSRVALGGPSRVVKVYALGAEEPVAKLTKHTDWVTAVAFSPDAALLASADRAGGIFLWEAETLAPYLALAPHAARVTALEWSADGNLLVSASEDGKIRIHDANDGHVVREWAAHEGGVTAMTLTPDGKVVSGGRDRTVRVWNPDGSPVVAGQPLDAIVVAVAATAGNAEIVTSDLSGRVVRYRRADLGAAGTVDTNPRPLDERRALAAAAGDATALWRLEGGTLRRARDDSRRVRGRRPRRRAAGGRRGRDGAAIARGGGTGPRRGDGGARGAPRPHRGRDGAVRGSEGGASPCRDRARDGGGTARRAGLRPRGAGGRGRPPARRGGRSRGGSDAPRGLGEGGRGACRRRSRACGCNGECADTRRGARRRRRRDCPARAGARGACRRTRRAAGVDRRARGAHGRGLRGRTRGRGAGGGGASARARVRGARGGGGSGLRRASPRETRRRGRQRGRVRIGSGRRLARGFATGPVT
jgi:cytochrome c553